MKTVAQTNVVEADKCTRSSENGEAQRAAFSILDFTMENYTGAENPAQYKGTGKVFLLLFFSFFFLRNASTILPFFFLQEHYYIYVARRNDRFYKS